MTIICIFRSLPPNNPEPDDHVTIEVAFWRRDDLTGSLEEIGNPVFSRLNFHDTIAAIEQFGNTYQPGTFAQHFGGINNIGGGTFSIKDWRQSSIDRLRDIGVALNHAVSHASWSPIREAILGKLNAIPISEPLRLVFNTQDVRLQSFPLELSSFVRDLTSNHRPVSIIVSPSIHNSEAIWGEQPQILLILGCQKKIDIPFDLAEIQSYFPHAEITPLSQPSREDILTTITDGKFDGMIFIAHCRANPDGHDGYIDINDHDSIAIEEFFSPFQHSVGQRLKFVFIAGCSSIGLARVLSSTCRVPHVLSFREPVHYAVVRLFLQRLHNYWVKGHDSLEVAVAKAKGDLRSQDTTYPGASILPILFSPPRIEPLTFPRFLAPTTTVTAPPSLPPTNFQRLLHSRLFRPPVTITLPGVPLMKIPPIAFIAAGLTISLVAWKIFQHPTPLISASGTLPNLENMSIGERQLIFKTDSLPKRAGIEAFKIKDYAGAIAKFEESLRHTPNDPETRIYMNNAKALQKAKDPQKLPKIVVISSADKSYETGNKILTGASQAQEQIGNRNFLLEIATDDNDLDLAKSIANQAIADPQVKAVVGHLSSDISEPTAHIYQQNGLVMISPTASTMGLKNIGKFIFRTPPNSDMMTAKLGEYITKTAKRKKLGFCYDSTLNSANSFKESLSTQLKNTELMNVACDVSQPNFSAAQSIKAMNEQGADGLAIYLHADRDAHFKAAVSIAEANAGKLPLYGSHSLVTLRVLGSGTDFKDIVLVVARDPSQPEAQDFRDRAQKLWGKNVYIDWRNMTAFDAVKAISTGLDWSNNGTREELKNKLHLQNFVSSGSSGPVKFSEGGDRLVTPILTQVKPDGKGGWKFELLK